MLKLRRNHYSSRLINVAPFPVISQLRTANLHVSKALMKICGPRELRLNGDLPLEIQETQLPISISIRRRYPLR